MFITDGFLLFCGKMPHLTSQSVDICTNPVGESFGRKNFITNSFGFYPIKNYLTGGTVLASGILPRQNG